MRPSSRSYAKRALTSSEPLHDGDLERAGRLIACAQRIFEETGTIPDPDDHVELDEAVPRLEQELGDRFDAVWGEGRTLGPGEAEALARG